MQLFNSFFNMDSLELLEALSYVVTIFGFPFAIAVFMYERRKEQQTEDEEIYQRLSDEYADFLRMLLDNSDLHLFGQDINNQDLSAEQLERKKIVFEILVSLFERAYILVYDDNMNKQAKRLWQSWEDYMIAWCKREDFRAVLPQLLEGEDPDFQQHIHAIVSKIAA